DPIGFGREQESQEARPQNVGMHAGELGHEVGGAVEGNGAHLLGGDAIVVLLPADGLLIDLRGSRGLSESEFLDQLGGEFGKFVLGEIDVLNRRHGWMVIHRNGIPVLGWNPSKVTSAPTPTPDKGPSSRGPLF